MTRMLDATLASGDPSQGRSPAHPGLVVRRSVSLFCVLVALVAVCALSIGVGSLAIPPVTVWHALTGSDHSTTAQIVMQLRLPRTVAALVVGVALGTGGALMQAMTRNPLADPGVLGVTSGASFSVAIGIIVFGATSSVATVWFAFGGALVTTGVVYVIGTAGRAGVEPVRLLLGGMALAAVLTGITTALTLLDPDAFSTLLSWIAGSLADRGWDVVVPVLPVLAVGMILAIVSARPLDAVALGDDLAASLGVNTVATRVTVIVAVALLAGGATAIAGPIAFLGLMVPHVAKWLVGSSQGWIIAFSALLGPVVLMIADVIGRVIAEPSELPVGIVLAFVGAPTLIVIVRRRGASAL